MPAIAPHSTATTDAAWDGPAAKANLKNDADASYYRQAFAWSDPDGDPKTKAAYKFIHHMVSGGGDVGAANLTACSTGIGVLNGGRGGTVIPDSDRKGVWNHLARHLRDADKEPPPLSSYEDYLNALMATNAHEQPLSLVTLLALSDGPWAITPQALDGLMRKAVPLEIVAARLGSPQEEPNPDLEKRNGSAVLNIRGPLFRYRSIFTWLLGGSSIEQLSNEFDRAMDDPSVKRVTLAINSPGGQVDGINAFANKIRVRSEEKPVTAYVDGLAGSGAYWLAAAANRIISDESAHLGSIGVLATVMDDRAADERRGITRYDVVSSQSPLKRADPATDEGRQQLQAMVDSLAQLFINKVAQFRGSTPVKVESDFGRGGVVGAQAAVAIGMADGLGSLEDVLSNGGSRRFSRGVAPMLGAAGSMPLTDDEEEEEEEEEQEEGTDNPEEEQEEENGTKKAQFDEGQLDDNSQVNETYNCPCPPGSEDGECECNNQEDESEGTVQEPDTSSVPRKGEGHLIKPTAERQRIAAILTCEEARGREALARVLALETDHTLEAARKLLRASPKAANDFDAHMAQIPNPKVGIAGTSEESESPAAEVARILAFVPKERKRPQVQ